MFEIGSPASSSRRGVAKTLAPVCGYTGGKRKFSAAIVDCLLSHDPAIVYDVGVGSGAITLELLFRGWSARKIVCVDAGPWGLFWKQVSDGSLDTNLIADWMKFVAEENPRSIKGWVENDIANLGYTAESFLVLQAASFGSTPVWWDGEKWRRGSRHVNRLYRARSYWEPGACSKETKPRGTIFTPMKIAERVRAVALAARGITAFHCRAEEVSISSEQSVTYIDPPYRGTSGYGEVMDLDALISKVDSHLYVSEGIQLPTATKSWKLSKDRKGASLNGKSKRKSEEWINYYKNKALWLLDDSYYSYEMKAIRASLTGETDD